MNDRYTGKPFLEFVDAYVLDAIGQLDAATDAALTAREPDLRREYGVTGNWRQIVAARMAFPAGLDGAVREVWQSGRTRFVAAQGREPDPVEFARHFIDTKFAH